MKELLIATGNMGKYGEIRSVLEGLPFSFISSKDKNIVSDDLEESGKTYEENAIIKANYYFDKSDIPLVLAEDSGLVVDALEGELGLHTRRWGAGAAATDEEWLDHFLKRMESVKNRRARFICHAALIINNKVETFSGIAEGEITHKIEAPMLQGLPLSSCFRPQGYDRVYAALSKEEKGGISHRGMAINKVRDYLLLI